VEEKFLTDRVAVITGGSRGFGKAMGMALGKAGAKLSLVARHKEQLDEAVAQAAKAGIEAEGFVADVSDETQVRQLEEKIVARFGRVDILINNAGTTVLKPVIEYTLAEWRKVIDTNLTAAFLMCRACVPHMRGRGYGRIISQASIMAHISTPLRGPYSASKAGLLGLTKSLAQELAPDGITAVTISPGPFATDMTAPVMADPVRNQQFMDNVPLKRYGNVEEAAGLVLYVCSPAGGFITGSDILIDGGWTSR